MSVFASMSVCVDVTLCSSVNVYVNFAILSAVVVVIVWTTDFHLESLNYIRLSVWFGYTLV